MVHLNCCKIWSINSRSSGDPSKKQNAESPLNPLHNPHFSAKLRIAEFLQFLERNDPQNIDVREASRSWTHSKSRNNSDVASNVWNQTKVKSPKKYSQLRFTQHSTNPINLSSQSVTPCVPLLWVFPSPAADPHQPMACLPVNLPWIWRRKKWDSPTKNS